MFQPCRRSGARRRRPSPRPWPTGVHDQQQRRRGCRASPAPTTRAIAGPPRGRRNPYRTASTRKDPAMPTRSAALARNGALMRSSAITMLMIAPTVAFPPGRGSRSPDHEAPRRRRRAQQRADRGAGVSDGPSGATSASSASTDVAAVKPTTSRSLAQKPSGSRIACACH